MAPRVLYACLFVLAVRGASLRDAPLGAASAPFYLDSPACAWTAAEPSLGLSVPATVPGDIITDLQRARVIGDPYYELNWLDNRTLWDVSARAWNYSTVVQLPPPGAPPAATLLLVFEGIKMGARVLLNGVELGVATNQFVRYIFPLPAAAVVAGANRVDVVFDASLSLAGRYMASSGGCECDSGRRAARLPCAFPSRIFAARRGRLVPSPPTPYLFPHWPSSPLLRPQGTGRRSRSSPSTTRCLAAPSPSARAFGRACSWPPWRPRRRPSPRSCR